MFPRAISYWLGATVVPLCSFSSAFAADLTTKRLNFDLPADLAAVSLKNFARQSGVEVLIRADLASEIRTRAVKGEMTSREAITAMLRDTGLTVEVDEKNGVFAIRQESASKKDQPKKGAGKSTKRSNLISRLIAWGAVAIGHVPSGHAADINAGGSTILQSTISGRVSNAATGEGLPGAVIILEGTPVNGVTERGGAFNLSVPAGSHTLSVSFPGLDTLRLPITIEAGQQITRDIQLTSEIYKLEPFAVAGVREANALALQAQRQSLNPKLVSSIDAFGNPANNPGEVIQRLPGISTELNGGETQKIFIRGMGTNFSSFLIDGDRVASSTGTSANRDYQIQQYGTANVASVELIKAPQPDQDANAIAGYINVVTKRAFDQPGQHVTFSLGTFWRDIRSPGNPYIDHPDLDIFGFSYSNTYSVLGGKQNLGVIVDFNRRRNFLAADEVDTSNLFFSSPGSVYLGATTANPRQRIFGTGAQGGPNLAQNGGLGVDYKLNNDGFLFAKLTFKSNIVYQPYYRRYDGDPGATDADFTADSTLQHSILLPHAASKSVTESSTFKKTSLNYTLRVGGEQKFFQRSATLSTSATYSHANIYYPTWYRVQAATAGGLGFEIDRRGQEDWLPLFRQTAGPSIYDAGNYRMSNYNRSDYQAPDELYGFRADFKKTMDLVVPAYLKVGVKYDDDRRKQSLNYSEYTWVGADGVPSSADDVMTPYAKVNFKQGNGHYGPYPFLTQPGTGKAGDPLAVPQGYWAKTAANIYNDLDYGQGSFAKFDERVTAAYIMGNIALGKLHILAGLRVEDTATSGTSWIRDYTATRGSNSVGGSSLDPATVAANALRAQRSFVGLVTSDGGYRKVFPGIHFTYEPTDDLLLRASYNRSISRPAVASILPNLTVDPENRVLFVGNPDLKPYLSDNFEVSAERYFEPVGQFSAGVFLKEISNYSRSFDDVVPAAGLDGNGSYAGFTRTTTRNIGSARIRGFDINYQQQFSFLPGALKGLGGFANYTYLSAIGNFGATTITKQLTSLAPRSGNAGLSYRYRGLDVRLLANWVDQKYRGTSGGVDTFNPSRTVIDVKLQYTINRRYDFFLDVSNITNEPTFAQVTHNGILFARTITGTSYISGIRARF